MFGLRVKVFCCAMLNVMHDSLQTCSVLLVILCSVTKQKHVIVITSFITASQAEPNRHPTLLIKK